MSLCFWGRVVAVASWLVGDATSGVFDGLDEVEHDHDHDVRLMCSVDGRWLWGEELWRYCLRTRGTKGTGLGED